MAESSRNAVVDNAAKDSYFLMHIAPTRRKDREMRARETRRRDRYGKTEREEGKAREIKGNGGGQKRGKQRLDAKVASAGETSEYGDAGADIGESCGQYREAERKGVNRGYMQIFFQPPRKTEILSLSHFAFHVYPCLSIESRFLLSSASVFSLSITCFSRRLLSFPSLYLHGYAKEKREKKNESESR